MDLGVSSTPGRHVKVVSRRDVPGGQTWTPFSVRFTVRNTLLAATLYVLAYQILVTVLALVNGAYDMTMFTLWSFTWLSAFIVVLLVSLFVEHLLFTLAVLFGLPIILGNVMFVTIVIVVIIANNDTVFLKDTICADPPPAHPIPMSKIHTGDWALHPAVTINVLVLLLAGGAYFSQHIIVRSLRSFPPWAQWLYFLYWMCASLVFALLPYQLAFDVDQKYPTSFTAVEREFIMLGVLWVWMGAAWFIFTADHTVDRREILSTSRVEWLPTPAELQSGRWTGQAAPSDAHYELVISAEAAARAAVL